jgi:hemerythrin
MINSPIAIINHFNGTSGRTEAANDPDREPNGGELMFLKWQKEHDVGHTVIDYDHRNLCNLINALHRDTHAGLTPEKITNAYNMLVEYVKEHFARKEELFLNSDYPDTKKHIDQHRRIEKRVQLGATLYSRVPDKFDTDEFLEFLKRWLTHHILETDQGYLPYIQNTEDEKKKDGA